MNLQKMPFSFIAITLGIILLILLINAAPDVSGGEPRLPLLTMLIISEFGFVVNAIGAFTAIKKIIDNGMDQLMVAACICCTALSVKFLLVGISYWPL